MTENTLKHERVVYGLLDVLGDFGGVQGILYILILLSMAPIAAHSFYLKAISKLYLAKTKESTLFENKKNRKVQRRNA